jgi:hypothetical protein
MLCLPLLRAQGMATTAGTHSHATNMCKPSTLPFGRYMCAPCAMGPHASRLSYTPAYKPAPTLPHPPNTKKHGFDLCTAPSALAALW